MSLLLTFFASQAFAGTVRVREEGVTRGYPWSLNFKGNTDVTMVGSEAEVNITGGNPGGVDTNVQFNDAGVFGGDAGLIYNKVTDVLTVGKKVIADGMATKPASTIVIAAFNSKGKNAADYVCDGTNDEVEIQAALDSMDSSKPGKIVLLEGQFNIGATINVTKSQTRIQGVGFATRLALAANANCTMFNVAYPVEAAFFELKDMWLHGNKDANTTGRGVYTSSTVKDVRITDVFVSHFDNEGIVVDNAWGMLINDSIIEYCGGDALVLNGGSFGKIMGSKIKANSGTAIQYNANVDYCLIQNNELDAPAGKYGIYLNGEGTVIQGNSFHDGGVAMTGIYAISDLSVIANNIFRGSVMTNAIVFAAGANNHNVFGNEFFISNVPISDSGTDNVYVGRTAANGGGSLEIEGGSTNVLSLNPKAGNDVELFNTAQVGDTVDGRKFIVHRKAAEGNDYLRMYIANNKLGVIDCSERLWIDTAGALGLNLQPNASTDLHFFTNAATGENKLVKQYGWITAALARKFISWQVDDTDDFFYLRREDSNILGFKVDMPLSITGTTTSTGGLITSKIYPPADSISALQITKADGTTNIVNIDTTNSRVGIGTPTPDQRLDVRGDVQFVDATDFTKLDLLSNSDISSNGSQILYKRSRGTSAAPTVVSSGDIIGGFDYFSYDGTAYINNARIRSAVDGTVGAGIVPSRLVFSTMSSTGALNTAIDIRATGHVGIGTPSPIRRLHAAIDDAVTNVITPVQRLTHTTTATPANGIGVGLEFEQETSVGNNEIIARIDAIVSDTTLDSEDGDIVFRTMAAGAPVAEKVRIKSTGEVGIGTALPGYALDVVGTINTTSFRMPTGAQAGYVLTSDALGVGTWQPAGGGGAITWPLLAPDGSATAPSYSFASETNLGMYRIGSQTLGFALAGGPRLTLNATALQLGVYAWALNGSATYPGYSFANDTDTGMFLHNPGILGISTSGTNRMFVMDDSIRPQVPFWAQNGSSSRPAYSFVEETGTGMYRIGANDLGWTIGTNLRMSLNLNGFWPRVPVRGTGGSAAAPAYAFRDDTDTGIYRVGENNMAFSTGSSWRMNVSSTEIGTTLPIRAQSGSAGSPAYSFSAESNLGMFRPGQNNLAFTTSGSERIRIDASGRVYIGTTTLEGWVTIYGRYNNIGLAVLDPNMSSGGTFNFLKLGRNQAMRNQADMAFYYVGNNSTSNYWGVGFYGLGQTLRVYASERVGIQRMATSNRLEVEGNASKTTAGSWLANSDERIKTDIQEIRNALNTIKKLRPVKFKFKKEYRKEHPDIEDRYYYNFIAQDYQKVFSDDVKGSGEEFEGKEILQMDTYSAQIVAIKAIQELQKQIEELRIKLEKLERRGR